MARGTATTMVFFGGSITWGATATDPMRTSWRALVEQKLRSRHPHTPMTVIDAAIGGQPAELGVFRMDRDVLPHKPHLVFVEFSVNDGTRTNASETMEGLICKLCRHHPQAAIVPVVFGAITPDSSAYDAPAREAHLRVFHHYGLPVVDAVPVIQAKMADGLKSEAFLTDQCHPNDRGYELYADIVIKSLDRLSSLLGQPVCAPLQPLTANRYESARMIALTSIKAQSGWEPGVPSLVGTWFDHTPSRWHDSTLRPIRAGARLEEECAVSGIGLYFEMVPHGKQLLLKADDAVHLRINTTHELGFARVNYAFQMLTEPGVCQIVLEAPDGGPTAAAYLLVTGGGL
ncbi:MAG: SGNH/GDSL hydrolase family protein [Planctomycetes bacterium]|nr:SGNH/GDSL hydrolase family protein [Planctomycetota bacterium]